MNNKTTNMKKLLLLFSLLALLLNACSSSDDNDNPVNNAITVTPSKVENISQDGDKFTIYIKTSGEWTIQKPSVDWCTLSTEKGTGNASVEVTIAKNESTTVRNTKLTISNGSTTTSVEVSQKAKEVYTTGEEAIIGGLWILDITYTPSYDIETSSDEAKKDIQEKLQKMEPYSDQYAFYKNHICDADGVSKDSRYSEPRENELNVNLATKPSNRFMNFTKSADNDNVLYMHERLTSQVDDKWPGTTKAYKTYRYTRK